MTEVLDDWRPPLPDEDPVELYVGTYDATDPDTATAYQRAALATCASCPVTADCARYAGTIGAYGVWGGHVYRQGRQIA